MDAGQGLSDRMTSAGNDAGLGIVQQRITTVLQVSPHAQGHGVGTQLIAAVVKWTREQGVPYLALGASAEVAALSQKQGFVRAGQYVRFAESAVPT